MINISKGIEIIKLIPKYLFPIVIFSGSIIFASEEFLNSLGIEKLVTDYRSWFSIVFLGSSAFLTSYTLIHIAKFIYRQFQYFFIVLTGKRRLKRIKSDLRMEWEKRYYRSRVVSNGICRKAQEGGLDRVHAKVAHHS